MHLCVQFGTSCIFGILSFQMSMYWNSDIIAILDFKDQVCSIYICMYISVSNVTQRYET